MAIRKQEWVEMKRSGLMFELTVRDQDWKKLETTKFNPHDFIETMKDVGNRYGINEEMLKPNEEIQKEINFLKTAGLIDR